MKARRISFEALFYLEKTAIDAIDLIFQKLFRTKVIKFSASCKDKHQIETRETILSRL